MPLKCCVANCSNRPDRGKEYRFFRIPAINYKSGYLKNLSKKRRDAWIAVLEKKENINWNNARVCSKHFITGSPAKLIEERHSDWSPSIEIKNSKPFRLQPYVNVKWEVSVEHVTPEPSTKVDDVLNEILVANLEDTTVETDQVEKESNEMQKLKQHLKDKNELIALLKEKSLKTHKEYELKLQEKDEEIKKIAENYESEIAAKDKEIDVMAKQLKMKNMSIEDFKNNDAKILYFTGLPNFIVLSKLFDFLKEDMASSLLKGLNVFNTFIMTLLKMRLDLPFTYLAYKFDVSVRTISRLFHENVIVLHSKLSGFVHWPDSNALKLNTPDYFAKVLGSNFTAIIDCFEIFTETPGDVLSRSEIFSSYKHHSTIKYLIGISPAGAIIFVSKGYGGRCSDKFLVENSGFLDHIKRGDIILSDRGMLVNRVVEEKGAKLLMPAFRNGDEQMDIFDIERTRNLAKVRIHVERVIGLLRQKYLICSNRQPITCTSKTNGDEMYFDYIVKICCSLVNLNPSIINIRNN